jgi:hypothetical protein
VITRLIVSVSTVYRFDDTSIFEMPNATEKQVRFASPSGHTSCSSTAVTQELSGTEKEGSKDEGGQSACSGKLELATSHSDADTGTSDSQTLSVRSNTSSQSEVFHPRAPGPRLRAQGRKPSATTQGGSQSGTSLWISWPWSKSSS